MRNSPCCAEVIEADTLMKKRRLSTVSLAALLFSFTTAIDPAHASDGYLKLNFSGTVTSLSPGYEVPGINVDDSVAGVLVFDPATPDSQPLATIGYYSAAIKSLDVKIGDKSFSMMEPPPSPTSEINVINDDYWNGTYRDSLMFKAAVVDQSSQATRFFQLTFSQSAGVQPISLTSDALAQPIDLGAFGGRFGFLTYMPPGASQGNNIALTSVSLSPFISPVRGDVDGNLIVNLTDAILSLQVMSESTPPPTVFIHKEADVDGDGQIGMSEVLYILQMSAGVR